MPLYDYKICETGQVVEVMHSSSTEISTWGELAQLIGRELEGLQSDGAVIRQITGRVFVNGNLEDLSQGKVVQKSPNRLRGGCCGGGCGH
jgi:hypothetical protein